MSIIQHRPPHHTRRAFILLLAMATPQQQIAVRKESRLELAIQAYDQGRFLSYTATAKAYDIPRTLLQRRLNGTQPRVGSIAKNRLLMATEEKTFVQWILSMDKRNMPPKVGVVREMSGLFDRATQQIHVCTTSRPELGTRVDQSSRYV